MSHLSYWVGRDLDRMQRIFERWPGYRPWKYQRARGYHMHRILARGATNERVYRRATTAPSGPAAVPVIIGTDDFSNLIDGRTLDGLYLPKKPMLIDEIMAAGSTLLIGKPKKGKSWMALEISLAVATGTAFMGYAVTQGDVLYLALEDNRHRIQSRMRTVCNAKGVPVPGNVRFGTIEDKVPGMDNGFVDRLRRHFERYPHCRLVIVDTLKTVRPAKTRGEDSYEHDRRALDPFTHMMADFPGKSVIVVHHARKAGTLDVHDSASGTTGLVGAVDQAWFLTVHDETGGLVLAGVGRDIEPFDFAVEREDGLWVNKGDPDEANMSEIRSKIMNELNLHMFPRTPNEIAKAIDEKPVNVRNRLKAMLKGGWIEKDGYGKYKSLVNSKFGPPLTPS
jgi:AAA domain-containing protein